MNFTIGKIRKHLEKMRSTRLGKIFRTNEADEAGFTLVELMVALMILSIGIMGIARLFVFSNQHALSGGNELEAVSLMQEIREKILSETFEDVPSIFDGVDTYYDEQIPVPCQDWAYHLESQLGSEGRGQIDIINPGEESEILTNMIGVAITISWPEKGQTHDISMRFAISKVGQ